MLPLTVGDTGEIGLELIQDTVEKIKMIQERIKFSKDEEQAYANQRKRKDLEFQVEDYVWIKVFPMKGVMRHG